MGLKVAMVTPWGKNIRCGIRSYSEDLIRALVEQDVDVYVVRLSRFGRKTPRTLQNTVNKIPVDRVDVVHLMHEYGLTQELDGGFYGALDRLDVPLVTTMHAVAKLGVDRVVADVSDRVIVHNRWCYRKFGGSKKNVVVIAHGCAPTETPPMEECKRQLDIDPRIPVVGYLGFISEAKGLEFLIEAMVGIEGAALLIGGGWYVGPDTQYIMELKKRTFRELKGRCRWLGYVPDERMATVYGACEIIGYPSRYMTESGALLTALSHGRAVIASDLAPVREKAKLDALMTFKDAKDLRRKIKRLLKDDELRKRLERGARRYCYENRWEAVAEKHVDLYKQLVDYKQLLN